MFIIASGGIMCAKLAMTVLAVNNYYIGWTFIPILAIGAGFNCLSSFQKSVYLLEKKTVPSFLSTAFSAVINIALNALLIPRYGGTGAAAATLTSYVALFIYRALDSRRFMPIRWKRLRLGLTVLLLAVQAALMLTRAAVLAHLAAAAVRCGRSAQQSRTDGSILQDSASAQKSINTRAPRNEALLFLFDSAFRRKYAFCAAALAFRCPIRYTIRRAVRHSLLPDMKMTVRNHPVAKQN
ncbi:MAG: polysaccharide biosynthesis C-terminal domain-containing protein [Butyricicoccaceae bacterium]